MWTADSARCPLTAARLGDPVMVHPLTIAYAGVPRDVGLRWLERAR